MGGFSTSGVAAQVQAPQINPLQMFEQLALTRNLLNQNQMFQSQQAAGRAFQGAIDPTTGAVSQNRLMTGLTDPAAALAAAPMAQAGQTLATGQQALGAARAAAVRGTIGPLMTAPNLQASDVRKSLNVLAGTGAIPQDMADTVAGSLPTDPAALRSYLTDTWGLPGLGAAGALGATAPASTLEDTGGALTALRPAPQIGPQTFAGPPGAGGVPTVVPGGPPTVVGSLPITLAPKDLASPVETVDNAGTKTMGVMGDYINPDGSWKSGQPHPMTALGPLSAATQQTLGNAYGPQIAAFEGSAPQIAAGRQAVENLRTEGDQFSAGPQSDFWKHLGELGNGFGLTLPGPAGPGETAAREAYAKNLTLVLSAQQRALHMDATDAARQTAELSVPSEMTTPEGRNRALSVVEGNLDAQNAMISAWQKQKEKGGPASWGQFQMEFPNRVPPSVFQAQYMNAPDLAKMQGGWLAAKKADWQARYDQAKKLGWLPNAQ